MELFEGLHAFVWLNATVNNCNTFFIDGQKKILIDPGHNHLVAHLRDNLSSLSLSPQDIDVVIITHGHPDHMEGLKTFAETATICIHNQEMDFIREVAPHYGEALGLPNFEPHILLREGMFRIENISFQVIHTPGHSPGSISLYWPDKKALFTGDLVFYQGVGRTDLTGGNAQQLKESIKRLALLEVDYLLPGHGQIISGLDLVRANFDEIERTWFAYL